MRAAAPLVLVAVLACAGACTRDPWADLKPHQQLAKAQQMLRQGDPQAGKALQGAYDKALRADFNFVTLREYALPLFQYHALRGDLAGAEPLFERINRPPEEIYVYMHAANNLAILYARAGRRDDALRVIAKAMHTVALTSPEADGDRPSLRVAMLANFDRIAFAAGQADLSGAAHSALATLLEDLARFQRGRYWPLEPGVKQYLGRYTGFLRLNGRTAEAERIDALVTTIEGHARSDDVPATCVAQDKHDPVLCVMEAG